MRELQPEGKRLSTVRDAMPGELKDRYLKAVFDLVIGCQYKPVLLDFPYSSRLSANVRFTQIDLTVRNTRLWS